MFKRESDGYCIVSSNCCRPQGSHERLALFLNPKRFVLVVRYVNDSGGYATVVEINLFRFLLSAFRIIRQEARDEIRDDLKRITDNRYED